MRPGNCSVETIGNIFAPSSRQASSNYGIGTDGVFSLSFIHTSFFFPFLLAMSTQRLIKDWTALSLECQSGAPLSLETSMVIAKACPGNYLLGKHGYIVETCNKMLAGDKVSTTTPVTIPSTNAPAVAPKETIWKFLSSNFSLPHMVAPAPVDSSTMVYTPLSLICPLVVYPVPCGRRCRVIRT